MAGKAQTRQQHKAEKVVANSMEGLEINHFFTKPGVHPYQEMEWKQATAQLANEKGEIIFEQKDVEMPNGWSQLATNVVVSKYFKGKPDSPDRETSMKQVIDRVADTITDWGLSDGYFATPEEGDIYRHELKYLLVNQMMAFNSPVWFNVGVEKHPQCSACFINSVEDTMESILDLAKTEGMLFKYGSGAGVNLSPLRSSVEGMSGGGMASGPVSFMRGYDAFAGVIKSGGKTRRAAKMVILDIEHPDIEEFVECKVKEERKAHALLKAGFEGGLDGEAYSSIFFQNANHSVRVTDEFMHAVLQDGEWHTRGVTDNEPLQTHQARELLDKICQAAWETGDPGFQFDTTINEWHTCPNSGRISASNPCSEYMFLDNSACNLASLNLMKFVDDTGEFDVEAFKHAVRITILAQEIIVDNASYPTKQIEKNSHDYRPLGLGYTNLGALLMSRGLPYDSNAGRAYAGVVTALMHGTAYRTSTEIAAVKKPFRGYQRNRKPMLRVMRKHADALDKIETKYIPEYMYNDAVALFDEMLEMGEKHGYRNSQVTVLAPTGTISFLMDCDTTGIEPDIALVKYKKLVGGGMLPMVNRTVSQSLQRLGYDDGVIKRIVEYIREHETIEGAPGLKDEHLPIFDCALKPAKGDRSIHFMGHIRMMESVQPFISGAISKTVNMPHNVTAADIYNTYLSAWQMGLKAIAIYRDGCKAVQPVSTSREEKKAESGKKKVEFRPRRIKLPDERKSITHKFSIGGHEGYITVGMYKNGQPGEIFIVMSKEGSVVSGLMDSFATAISLSLQYGVPIKVLIRKFIHTRFEPSGYTNNRDIPMAHSVMDYIFRWLALKFLPPDEHGLSGDMGDDGSYEEDVYEDGSSPNEESGSENNGKDKGKGNKAQSDNGDSVLEEATRIVSTKRSAFAPVGQSDAPPCPNCGSLTIRSGACYSCPACGSTTGCG